MERTEWRFVFVWKWNQCNAEAANFRMQCSAFMNVFWWKKRSGSFDVRVGKNDSPSLLQLFVIWLSSWGRQLWGKLSLPRWRVITASFPVCCANIERFCQTSELWQRHHELLSTSKEIIKFQSIAEWHSLECRTPRPWVILNWRLFWGPNAQVKTPQTCLLNHRLEWWLHSRSSLVRNSLLREVEKAQQTFRRDVLLACHFDMTASHDRERENPSNPGANWTCKI